MSNHAIYIPTHPGRVGTKKIADCHIPAEDVWMSFIVPEPYASSTKSTFPLVGNVPYTSAQWTVTSSGTGAAQAQATTANGGILLTTGSTSTFYSGLQSKAVITPGALVGAASLAAGGVQRFSAWARIQVSHATQVGFNFGFANAQADPTNTEYTDFIGFRKAPTSASLLGTVVGNSGSVTQTSNLQTMVAATEYYIGFVAGLATTAAASSGYFYVGTDMFSGTTTAMSTTILTELVKFLTTPPTTMGLTLFATGTSGNNPTATFSFAAAQVDY